jgi:ankyrin repeat protein
MSRSFLVALMVATCVVDKDPAQEVSGGLSIKIVPTKTEAGAAIIDRGGKFKVVFTNHGKTPIRIWAERSPTGHDALWFGADDSGQQSVMAKRQAKLPDMVKSATPTEAIAPGASLERDISPSEFFWGERKWKGVPEPNTGKAVRFHAVYEVTPSATGREAGVWIGRVASNQIEVTFVDPELRTVHSYLENDCPKQAIRLLRADPTLIDQQVRNGETPLHVAAHYGFTEVVEWLLMNKADPNTRAYNQFTPLHLADDPAIVKLLVKYKADVSAKDSSGNTPLMRAASRYAPLRNLTEYAELRDRWLSICKILREAGAPYDLVTACYLRDIERVRALLDVTKQAPGKDVMRLAATLGDVEIVKLLLKHGADPEDAGYGGLPVAYFAIEHPEVLKVLFDAGANPKAEVTYRGSGNGPRGSTLLREAVAKGSLESARLLVARGLAPDMTLSAAAAKGDLAMVDWLLKIVDVKSDGRGAMSAAAYEVRPEHDDENARFQAVIRRLERAGVELDLFAAVACNDTKRAGDILRADPKAAASRRSNGQAALHVAVALDRREIVKLLLDNGCAPDIRNESATTGHEQGTALHDAAFWGRPGLAELLIKRGAKVNAKSKRDVVPLHEAARMGNIEVARILLMNGANVNAEDGKKQTPLDWSKDYREVPAMGQLLRDNGGRGSSK